MYTFYKTVSGVAAMLLSGVAISQSFTNCIPYVQGRPDQGMNCTTTNTGSNAPLFVDPGTAFSNGYNAANQVGRDSQRNNMINRARQDCNNGVARACEYLKQNNVY